MPHLPNPPQAQVARTVQILALAACGMTILLALLPAAGHDQLWLLLAAARVGPHLDPYGSLVFESNPPLALWLSGLLILVARTLHLPITVCFKLVVTLVAACSGTVSFLLLRRTRPDLTRAALWWLAFTWILIVGAMPARDFGQRDHILMLLCLPYLLAAGLHLQASAPGGWSPGRARAAHRHPALQLAPRAAITLIAALGIALKPHQVLIPLTIEGALAVLRWKQFGRTSPSPGSAASGTGSATSSRGSATSSPGGAGLSARWLEITLFPLSGLLYVGAIRLFAPTYLAQVLPVLRDTYWALGHLTPSHLLGAAVQLHLLAVATLLAYRTRPSRSAFVLILAGLAATGAYYLQGTGWYYQQLPALSLFALALAVSCLDRLPSAAPRWLPVAAAALAVLALLLTTYFMDFHLTYPGRLPSLEQAQASPDPSLFAGLPSGAAVATLTTSVDDTVMPAIHFHLTLAQRYPHLWMLPALLRNESPAGEPLRHVIPPARLVELDRLQHAFMVEDLTRWHPRLILIARCQDPRSHCQALEDRHDDLLAFFLRDPAFRAIFGQYHLLRSSGLYDAYVPN